MNAINICEILRNDYVNRLESRFNRGLAGISTGFSDLDSALSGLRRGNLILLAGQSLMGKTALALQIAAHVAAREAQVLYFSPGMTRGDLVDRLLSQACNIPLSQLLCAGLQQTEWLRLLTAVEVIYQHPLYIDDSPALTAQSLVDRAVQFAELRKPGLIVVDDMELIDGEPETLTRKLKKLAKLADCPVLLLSQVGFKYLERPHNHKRALLTDLGDTATPADVVLLVFRDEISDPDTRGESEVVIAKNKNGAAARVRLRWRAEVTAFVAQEGER